MTPTTTSSKFPKLPSFNPPRSDSLVSLNSQHSSLSSSSIRLGYLEEDKEQDWFKREFSKSTFSTQSYHPFSSTRLPYWISYSQGALNWDSLQVFSHSLALNHGAASFLPVRSASGEMISPPPPPKKVLSLGSGFPFWELEMAAFEGWESTEFVCLDIAPYSLPIEAEIPFEISSRISFVQCDFLSVTGFPFSDGSFDYVRVYHVGIGIPENKWELVIEEANRVLLPGCTIEICDINFTIYKPPSPLPPPSTSPSPTSLSPIPNPFSLVEECFEAVFEPRFINTNTLVIPSSLLKLFCSNVQSTGILKIPLPSSPASKGLAVVNTPFEKRGDTFRTLGGSNNSSESARIQLHAYAERLESSSHGIARDGAQVEYERLRKKEILEAASLSESDGILLQNLQKKITKEKRLEELQRERVQALNGWTDDLKDRAGLSQLLSNQWGWECLIDLQAKEMLESNIPVFKEALVEIEKEKEVGGKEKVIEARKNQLTFGQREAEVELKAVNKRLGVRDWEAERGGTVGSLETCCWNAKAK